MTGLHRICALALALSLTVHVNIACAQDAIRVGSKSFTENFILGEIIAQVAEQVALALAGESVPFAVNAS